LLFLLIPILAAAKLYSGKVTMNSGTMKTGLIELPEYPSDATLKYRDSEKGSPEKLSIDDVAGFEFLNDDNVTIQFVTLRLGKPKLFSASELDIDKKKSWVRIVQKGKISIYAGYYQFLKMGKMGSTGGGVTFYVRRPNDDYALNLAEFIEGKISFNMNGFSNIKNLLKFYFDKDCPQLANSLTKDDLKKDRILAVTALYDKNCGTK
jgi:hypothetical protein